MMHRYTGQRRTEHSGPEPDEEVVPADQGKSYHWLEQRLSCTETDDIDQLID
jgi:hypothetical protein